MSYRTCIKLTINYRMQNIELTSCYMIRYIESTSNYMMRDFYSQYHYIIWDIVPTLNYMIPTFEPISICKIQDFKSPSNLLDFETCHVEDFRKMIFSPTCKRVLLRIYQKNHPEDIYSKITRSTSCKTQIHSLELLSGHIFYGTPRDL